MAALGVADMQRDAAAADTGVNLVVVVATLVRSENGTRNMATVQREMNHS